MKYPSEYSRDNGQVPASFLKVKTYQHGLNHQLLTAVKKGNLHDLFILCGHKTLYSQFFVPSTDIWLIRSSIFFASDCITLMCWWHAYTLSEQIKLGSQPFKLLGGYFCMSQCTITNWYRPIGIRLG